jgi:predicted TIM-barrel fold metal-dependent hydrolase
MAPTATESTNSTLQDALAGYHVIDCDSHWSEPADLWTAQAPASLRERTLRIHRVDGVDHWWMNGESWGVVGGSVVDREGHKVRGKLSLMEYDKIDRAGTDAKPRVELLDALGIWAQIVYPNAIGFGATRALRSPDVEARNFVITGYNNGLGQLQAESNGRLCGQAVLPFWDLDLMCKEAVRCVEELKLKGFTMVDRPEGFGLGLPDLGDPYWDPFFELVNDLRVPINFHIGSGSGAQQPGQATVEAAALKLTQQRQGNTSEELVFNMPLVGWASFGAQRRLAAYSTIAYLDNARIVTNLILSGLLDKWPNVKFVSVESGVGWVPGVIEGLEYQLYEMCPDEAKLLKRTPREYFRDQIYACWWFESFGPRYAIKEFGPYNFLFETDFPHPTCLYPDSQRHVAEVMASLTPFERQRMLQDNGAELYKIPIPVTA